jgi:septal ring factor EnvC (AmiA/AmiB activator)
VRRLLLATILLCASPQAFADTAAQRAQKAAAQKQLLDTRETMRALALEQRRLEAQRGAAAQALRDADGKVAGLQQNAQHTQQEIAGQERDLAQLQQRRATLEATLAQQRGQLAALVRSAYALGGHTELKLLLEQDRLSDLARVLAYHRYFQRDREQRITGINAQLQSLADLAAQIEARKSALLAAQARQATDLAALARQRKERGQVVATLDSSYRDRSARLQALGRDEKSTVLLLERLRKLMAQMPRPPVPQRKPGPQPGRQPGRQAATIADAAIPLGPLNLPLAGSVLAGFGGVMPDGHKSQGLLIAGSAGALVHAVTAGRVAYADWLKGYGLLVILDHGNGWMTLYAFNDSLLKKAGESVSAGEAISTVGSSGGQGRAALYFELRRNGQPQDPRSWLRK